MLRIETENPDLTIDRLDGGGIPVYYYKRKPFTGVVYKNDSNGILSFEEEYNKGFQEGMYTSYHKNGKKKKEYKSHNNDIVKNTFKKWDEDGNLIESF